MMIPIPGRGILRGVEGTEEALTVTGVTGIDISIHVGGRVVPLPEGNRYLGFIFAQAPDYQQTYAALKSAYSKLRFVTQPRWNLQQLIV